MKKQNVRTLSLIVCTFTYLLVGAAIFDALESEPEAAENRELQEIRANITARFNLTRGDWDEIRRYVIRSIPHDAGIQWKFSGAFYFTTIVITTIGYGHSTPRTMGGKIFCMAYALTGIPLSLVMFQSIGERLNIFITFIIKNFKKCFKFKNTEVSQTNLIIVTLNLSTFLLAGGAAVFSSYERWSYVDAFYYCFITLTTIGFGDYVALQQNEALQKKPEYVALCLLFILCGLTILSAAMNLLVLRFLTMNTEDERREEREAAMALRCGFRLDGDVITANGGMLAAAQQAHLLQGRQSLATANGRPAAIVFDDDVASVCSCVSCSALPTCIDMHAFTGTRSRGQGQGRKRVSIVGGLSKRRSPHYTVRRAPGKITHLLPAIGYGGGEEGGGGRGSRGHCGPQSAADDEDDNYVDSPPNSFALAQMLQQKRASV